jgi:8-oxo-dGTP diphosphatase
VSAVRVRAVDETGSVVLEADLAHGADPGRVLTNAGWGSRWVGAHREGHAVVLEYAVVPAPRPHPHQRLAAYAVVLAPQHGRSSVLLTSFTAAPDSWGLPGGGVDEGEHPQDAVVREVWEETGQQVEVDRELAVDSAHWTGRSPAGRWEDFHALRLVYVAHCPRPAPTVVHDADGSTDRAEWAPLDMLPEWRLLPWAAPLIHHVVEASSDLP